MSQKALNQKHSSEPVSAKSDELEKLVYMASMVKELRQMVQSSNQPFVRYLFDMVTTELETRIRRKSNSNHH